MAREVRARHVSRAHGPGTPGGGRSRKPGEERWPELLRAAAAIFARKGYATTTLQEIADELHMLKGSLYYYIHSKEDLLYEVVRQVLTDAEAQLARVAADGGTAVERLERVVAAHVTYLLSHLDETTVYLHEVTQLSPERSAQLPAHAFQSIIEDLLKEGQADGTVRGDLDPHLSALSVLGSANWVYRWYSPSGASAPEAIAAEIARFSRHAVEAQPARDLSTKRLYGEFVPNLPGLLALMRRYAYSYTAAHDFALLPELMVDDYVLRMGGHEVRGRDTAYRAATQRQYDQFPGLGFTVHDVVFNGERVALAFTEHGTSAFKAGRPAAWHGVSLYRWDAARLVECLVEQDYFSRRRQLERGSANPVACPALDPWNVTTAPPDGDAEDLVRAWLAAGGLAGSPYGTLDDELVGAPAERPALSGPQAEILDIFSAERTVAFACRVSGRYDGGLAGLDEHRGRAAALYATGIAVADGECPGGVRLLRAVTDRLGLARRLAA